VLDTVIRGMVLMCLLALLTGCSTVDRRTYYEPLVDKSLVSGPERLVCGWVNLGGAPDAYEGSLDGGEFRITTNQDIHPYLWGPWFASVVPVFPITWIVDAFIDDSLEVRIASSEALAKRLSQARFIAKIGTKEIAGTNALISKGYVKVKFSIDDSDAREFVLITFEGEERILEVPFHRTARWAWTQWTPNC